MLDQATAHVPVNLPVNAVGVPNGKVVRPPFQVPIRLSNQARDRLKAPRAAPNHPGRPSGSLPVASPPVSGFILVGGLAPSVFLSRPNRVYFILRLACFAHTNASPDELLHPALAGLHVRTGNLHGELLSVHKISQAYPGIPTVRERSYARRPSLATETSCIPISSKRCILGCRNPLKRNSVCKSRCLFAANAETRWAPPSIARSAAPNSRSAMPPPRYSRPIRCPDSIPEPRRSSAISLASAGLRPSSCWPAAASVTIASSASTAFRACTSSSPGSSTIWCSATSSSASPGSTSTP